jgi:hypothetical protein
MSPATAWKQLWSMNTVSMPFLYMWKYPTSVGTPMMLNVTRTCVSNAPS